MHRRIRCKGTSTPDLICPCCCITNLPTTRWSFLPNPQEATVFLQVSWTPCRHPIRLLGCGRKWEATGEGLGVLGWMSWRSASLSMPNPHGYSLDLCAWIGPSSGRLHRDRVGHALREWLRKGVGKGDVVTWDVPKP